MKRAYTMRTVKAINRAYNNGMKSTDIAKKYNLSQQQVAAIIGNIHRGVYSL